MSPFTEIPQKVSIWVEWKKKCIPIISNGMHGKRWNEVQNHSERKGLVNRWNSWNRKIN